MKLKPLIVIPARSGSKGIPDKNIKLLAGKPLVAYSIEVALQIADSSRIIFSTDSERYVSVARKCGLEVDYLRPSELATDTAGSREVILDAMRHADSKGIEYDCIVLLQPTSPLRTAGDVKDAMSLYRSDVDMVVSVTEASSNPYYNCFEQDSDTGALKISKGDGHYTRRQDAPPVYEFNGAVYVINPVSIRNMSMGSFPLRIPSVMDKDRSIDLDTPIDWDIAELILTRKTASL